MEYKLPNSKLLISKTAKKVGRKMRASKKGSKKMPSPASINNTMRKIDASWSLDKAIRINLVFLKIGKLLATV